MKKGWKRNQTVTPLKEAIDEFLKTYRLQDKMGEARVIQAWEKVVGVMVAKHTERIRIRDRVLFVRVNSSVVRNELTYARKKIITSLNREAGSIVIDDMVLS